MSSLNLRIKLGYGVGHILNDLCSAIWFSYLLLYFHHVLRFPNSLAGVVLLIGQIADALSTPFVGYEADRTDDLPFCTKYGRRKTWHLIGTVCVICSFPFIFVGCFGCTSVTSSWAQVLYFAPFVIVFQFGWASTQISHLAILPNLSSDQHERTELNAIRYASTVASTIAVYCITWLILGLTTTTTDTTLSAEDGNKFILIVLIIVGLGSMFSCIFHIMIKEKNDSYLSLQNQDENNLNIHRPMIWRDWLKEPQFFRVALIYMATRLFCNLSQAYIPIYLEDSLALDEKSIAYIPLVMYISGLITTMLMKPLNRLAGRKITFLIGCALGGSGALWVFFGNSNDPLYLSYYLYIVAVLIGSGASTMLVTILSLTADMIGSNIETGAFVYGSLSFTDKLSNGLVVMCIQYFTPCLECCAECKDYFRKVIGYACGGSVLLAVFGVFTLLYTTIGLKKFYTDAVMGSPSTGSNSLAHYIDVANEGFEAVSDSDVDDEERRINLSFKNQKDLFCCWFMGLFKNPSSHRDVYSALSQTEDVEPVLNQRSNGTKLENSSNVS